MIQIKIISNFEKLQYPNSCYIEKQTIFVKSCKRQTYIVDVFR